MSWCWKAGPAVMRQCRDHAQVSANPTAGFGLIRVVVVELPTLLGKKPRLIIEKKE